MIIEVAGVSTRNKGAELMLEAIRQHFARDGRNVRLAVSPWFGSYEDRARYGLLQKVEPLRWGRSRLGFGILPKSFRDAYGMVSEAEIDAVIDASGFAFGDQHPLRRTTQFASDAERWKRQGKRVILLPQALGPFEQNEMRAGFSRIVDASDAVFARDPVSLAHAHRATRSSPKIALAPDITIGVAADARRPEASADEVALIVPNARMLDKQSPDRAARYVPFLQGCFAAVRRAGLTPRVLLHDSEEDHEISDALRGAMGHPLDVVREADPVRLKSILGTARLLIGSRFHALVGALSQGTPTIAAGWSHKYETLMADFGCEDMILSPLDDQGHIEHVVRRAVENRDGLVRRIHESADRMRAELQTMWRSVDTLLGIS